MVFPTGRIVPSEFPRWPFVITAAPRVCRRHQYRLQIWNGYRYLSGTNVYPMFSYFTLSFGCFLGFETIIPSDIHRASPFSLWLPVNSFSSHSIFPPDLPLILTQYLLASSLSCAWATESNSKSCAHPAFTFQQLPNAILCFFKSVSRCDSSCQSSNLAQRFLQLCVWLVMPGPPVMCLLLIKPHFPPLKRSPKHKHSRARGGKRAQMRENNEMRS